MRLGLVIYSLGPGGAEKVASTLVNYWAKSADEITLVTLESTDKDFYRIDPRVRRVALGLGQRTKNWGEFISN
jgi:hypothetical protein